ncbi:hypothetical protein QLX08_001785 [Tetragonisca angustula]|uniref:Uncharacterized protein n=1 Tax=Tetragonisca angustula TaxID=166442 RepID=A0AAW1AG38_9HYME
MNRLAISLLVWLLVGFYCQADFRKNDRYLENFDLDTKKETAMENVIDTEGQTRFFDELGRKFYASLHREI